MDEQGRPSLRRVAEGVFAWVQPNGGGWVENAGAIVTPDGVILIDTGNTELHAQGLLWAVAHATSGARVMYAVNTHHQGDHTFGNRLLPEHTVIIGHETSRADWPADLGADEFWHVTPGTGAPNTGTPNTLALDQEEPAPRRPPTLTIGTRLSLHHGEHEVEVLHPGYPANTTGDLVAWLPRQGVLFSGGLLCNQGTPIAYQGSIDGSLRALDWIAGFAPDHVVPGHGPLIDACSLRDTLDAHRRYYQLVLDTAQAGVRDGLSPLEAARRCELGPFADLPDVQRIVLNLHRAYADITSGRFDLVRAISDTVSYNTSLIHLIG
jgi:cyclase